MNCLVVRLWGKELGTLVWDPSTGRTYFAFNPDASDRPDVSPIANPKANWRKEIPIFGDSRRIYHGLPPFHLTHFLIHGAIGCLSNGQNKII